MTVLSRALIRRMIIQEMRLGAPSRPFKPKLSSGLSFIDDEDTIDIDRDTEIDDVPSFMTGFEDTDIDIDADMDDFGFEYDDDDDDFEFESETEEDSESETEYNPGRQVMGMSRDEIRRHVMSQADMLSPDMSAKNKRTRAEMRYDDLVRQGREAEMPDPEFENTEDFADYEDTKELPADRFKKDLKEHVRKTVRQSIRRQILLL